MRVPKDINQAPEIWLDAWILYYSNALLMKCSLSRVLGQVVKLEHQPHSPDLTPFDFTLFPKTEDHSQVPEIFRECRHLGTCDNHSEEHYRRRLSEMF
jgi:hypothetical protein